MDRKFIIGIGICLGLLLIYVISVFRHRKVKKEKYNQLKNLVENLKTYNNILKSNYKIKFPILYINMDKHVQRREYMEKQLKRVSSNYDRVKGFNGYDIKDTTEDDVNGVKFFNEYPLTKGEIGCCISHIMAIKKAYDSGEDAVMICEDDLLLDTVSLVGKTLNEIVEKAPEDWDLLQLSVAGTGDGSLERAYEKLKMNDTLTFIKRDSPNKILFWGTACYLIKRKGMEKILNVVYSESTDSKPVITLKKLGYNFPEYGASDYYLLDIVNTYSVLPCLFIVNNLSLPSTIHDDHTDSHIRFSLIILSYFKPILNQKQMIFAKTLFDMDDILSENNQPYFLACGTALGAYRENKFIEHDEDIDLGIFAENYNKNIEDKILKKFKLKSRLGSIESGYEINFTHPETNVDIDIFLHYRSPEGEAGGTHEGEPYIWCPSFFNLCDKAKNKMCRWKYNFEDVSPHSFMGREFNLPKPIEQYLKDSYGDWEHPKKYSYEEGLNSQYKNLITSDFGKEGIVPNHFVVWQYWENKPGKTKPAYIQACMNSVKSQCEKDEITYIELNPENVNKYIIIPSKWKNIKQIAHKADYLRAILLEKYGGLWIDTDVIAKDSLKPFVKDLETSDLCVFVNEKDEFEISIFNSRKNSPFMREWISKMDEKINVKNDFTWEEIGHDILYPMWRKWKVENKGIWRVKRYKANETCYPLPWYEWKKFFNRGNASFLQRKFQPLLALYNNVFPDWFKNMSHEDFVKYIYNFDTVIADIFRN
jgi:GR25 family glycosyltransferase involved in LPS biosynthesis